MRSAVRREPAQGSSPRVTCAVSTRPSDPSVTSASAEPPPSGAPAGQTGAAPCRSSGMPVSRSTFGRASAKVIGTVRRTATALPSTFTGSYSHWLTAATAASSRPATLRMIDVDCTLPVGPMTMSTMTMPRMPWARASAG